MVLIGMMLNCTCALRLNTIKRRTVVSVAVMKSELDNIPDNVLEQVFTRMGDDGTIFWH